MANDFVFCSRRRRGRGFGNEPGSTRYLVVPRGLNPKPNQATERRDWIEQVLRDAGLWSATTGRVHKVHSTTGKIVATQ